VIRTLTRFRRFMVPYRRLLGVGGSLAVLDVVLGLAAPWPLKIVVDDVLRRGQQVQRLPFDASPRAVLNVAVVALVLAVLGAALADYYATKLLSGAGQRIGNDVRLELFGHLQRLSLRYHGQSRVGDLAARVTADVDRVQDLMVQSLATLLPNILLVAGMVVVMVVVDPQFAALALLTTPFMVLAVGRTTRHMKDATREARRVDGAMAAVASEHLSAIQVVQAFSLEDRSEAEFHDLGDESLTASLRAIRYQALLGPAVDVSGAVATAVLLWFGANRVLAGRMSLGLLLVFLTYISSLYKPIKALAKLTYVASRGAVCGERISAILAEQPEVADGPRARPCGRLTGAVSLEHVSFSYGREQVLHGIDLSVEPGEVVAIVGATGSGKSTLVSLIPRFFDPTEGVVRVDGRDLRDLTLPSLRSQVALVLQDSVLFRGTLSDNIALGRPGAGPEAVAEAARLALVDEFSDNLPDGLQTVVGERGTDLSGGQRQRIAIARAIVRDAPLLILDEPTSALDAESEMLVVQALSNLQRDRTTIVIAHRLSTVRNADRLLVLGGGRILEQGTHSTLLRAKGAYAHLSELQNLQTLDLSANGAPGKVRGHR